MDREPPPRADAAPRAWRRQVALLWLGQVVSHLGDSLYLVALVWLVLDVTGSKALTGGLVAVNFAPALVLGLFAGAFVDRHDRRRVMITADLLRAAAVGAIPFLHARGHLSGAVLAVLLLALSTGATFFNPAMKALLPDIVPPAKLTAAVAAFQLSEQIAFVGGPLLGGPATRVLGFANLFALDAATFLFSALCLIRLTGRAAAAPPDGAEAQRPRAPFSFRAIGREARLVLHVAGASPMLRALLVLTALDNLFIMGPATIATPLLVKETLGLGPSGYMDAMTFFFAGLIAGTLALWMFGRGVPKGRLILVGIILDGLTFIPLYFCRTLAEVQLALFVHALAIPLIIIPRTVLIQQALPGRMHGRVFALVNVTVFGMAAISSGLTGLAVERVPPGTLFLVVGVLGALPGFAGLGVRDLRRAR